MNTYVLISDTDGQNLLNLRDLQYAMADRDDWTIDLAWQRDPEGFLLNFATEQEFQDAFTLIVNRVAQIQSGAL